MSEEIKYREPFADLPRLPRMDWEHAVSAGRVTNAIKFNRFAYIDVGTGTGGTVGTAYTDFWSAGGIYPFQTAAFQMRIRAGGNANDTALGTGAQKIRIQYLDYLTWSIGFVDLVTAGASASSPTVILGGAIRFIRAWVEEVGAYGGQNAALIEIETTGGAKIGEIPIDTDVDGDGLSQTEMSHFTTPAGWVATIQERSIDVVANKVASFWFWRRERADVIVAPFSARREITRRPGVIGEAQHASGIINIPEKTDIWWSMKAAAINTVAQIDYEIYLQRNYSLD
ncbi:MAG: hypothetical protein KAJ07_04530 [Planctomycetes bacterium]|nr:hypothetical protein [Planctomycetota bacterium]